MRVGAGCLAWVVSDGTCRTWWWCVSPCDLGGAIDRPWGAFSFFWESKKSVYIFGKVIICAGRAPRLFYFWLSLKHFVGEVKLFGSQYRVEGCRNLLGFKVDARWTGPSPPTPCGRELAKTWCALPIPAWASLTAGCIPHSTLFVTFCGLRCNGVFGKPHKLFAFHSASVRSPFPLHCIATFNSTP